MFSLAPPLSQMRGQGGCLEAQLPTSPHIFAERSLVVCSTDFACPNRDDLLARPTYPRNSRSEPVRGQRTGKAGSGSPAAFPARRHRPRPEAKSRSASLEYRHSFGSRPALGAIERLLPHVTASPYVADSEINLAELGISSLVATNCRHPMALSRILTHESRSPSPCSIGSPSTPRAPPPKA